MSYYTGNMSLTGVDEAAKDIRPTLYGNCPSNPYSPNLISLFGVRRFWAHWWRDYWRRRTRTYRRRRPYWWLWRLRLKWRDNPHSFFIRKQWHTFPAPFLLQVRWICSYTQSYLLISVSDGLEVREVGDLMSGCLSAHFYFVKTAFRLSGRCCTPKHIY